MKFAFWNLIHWRRHSGWQEKLNVKLWQQGSYNIPNQENATTMRISQDILNLELQK